MKNIKLNWKKKKLEDESGSWMSAVIPDLKWEYVVDVFDDFCVCYLFLGPNVDEVNICPGKKFKTPEQGMRECEKHFAKTYEKIKKWVNARTWE